MVIELDPMVVIFGVAGDNNNNLTGIKLKVTKCVTLLTQRLTLLTPSWTQWLREVLQHLKLEKLRLNSLIEFGNHLSSIFKLSFNPPPSSMYLQYEVSQVYLLF